jgi:hypothetical protein
MNLLMLLLHLMLVVRKRRTKITFQITLGLELNSKGIGADRTNSPRHQHTTLFPIIQIESARDRAGSGPAGYTSPIFIGPIAPNPPFTLLCTFCSWFVRGHRLHSFGFRTPKMQNPA